MNGDAPPSGNKTCGVGAESCKEGASRVGSGRGVRELPAFSILKSRQELDQGYMEGGGVSARGRAGAMRQGWRSTGARIRRRGSTTKTGCRARSGPWGKKVRDHLKEVQKDRSPTQVDQQGQVASG